MRFCGMSPDGVLPEIIEYADHPWFIGVQFHPSSSRGRSRRTRCSPRSSRRRWSSRGWCSGYGRFGTRSICMKLGSAQRRQHVQFARTLKDEAVDKPPRMALRFCALVAKASRTNSVQKSRRSVLRSARAQLFELVTAFG
jgi:hypothetical protein